MQISFKVNGKETIVTLTHVRPIFVICTDCSYYFHICIGRMVQPWSAKYSQLFITCSKKVTSFLLFFTSKKNRKKQTCKEQANKKANNKS